MRDEDAEAIRETLEEIGVQLRRIAEALEAPVDVPGPDRRVGAAFARIGMLQSRVRKLEEAMGVRRDMEGE